MATSIVNLCTRIPRMTGEEKEFETIERGERTMLQAGFELWLPALVAPGIPGSAPSLLPTRTPLAFAAASYSPGLLAAYPACLLFSFGHRHGELPQVVCGVGGWLMCGGGSALTPHPLSDGCCCFSPDERYIHPQQEAFSIQLISPVSWETIPNTR